MNSVAQHAKVVSKCQLKFINFPWIYAVVILFLILISFFVVTQNEIVTLICGHISVTSGLLNLHHSLLLVLFYQESWKRKNISILIIGLMEDYINQMTLVIIDNLTLYECRIDPVTIPLPLMSLKKILYHWPGNLRFLQMVWLHFKEIFFHPEF